METNDDIHGHARPLAGLVAYQAGAVVSRTLIKQPAGSVTLFAFDAGQELSEHTVPHDALVHVLDGEVEISIAGTPHRLRAGDAIVMPGGRPHAVKAVEQFKMMLAMIRPEKKSTP
ncbi:MAG: cupin domain-containing protein [Candidatus Krumholzibacteria bacterium]|nr:cupin domain-containing protein [Candidatus Krumholzibacteria bacterium]MDH4336093.1 cupin domain-containing protein [Candidatus Krumholzibacteria bacterium]MDH5268734.1 cupin domain-containing protein [Candidatus Krumholzibacteria bacterium]MDH5628110.1 cupin domain-containing protein [Candidatus Krumholzibacteria bacterium]